MLVAILGNTILFVVLGLRPWCQHRLLLASLVSLVFGVLAFFIESILLYVYFDEFFLKFMFEQYVTWSLLLLGLFTFSFSVGLGPIALFYPADRFTEETRSLSMSSASLILWAIYLISKLIASSLINSSFNLIVYAIIYVIWLILTFALLVCQRSEVEMNISDSLILE
jgi:hypothetical protein